MMKWARVRFRGARFNWRGSGEIFDVVAYGSANAANGSRRSET